jgi:hypothetical protein
LKFINYSKFHNYYYFEVEIDPKFNPEKISLIKKIIEKVGEKDPKTVIMYYIKPVLFQFYLTTKILKTHDLYDDGIDIDESYFDELNEGFHQEFEKNKHITRFSESYYLKNFGFVSGIRKNLVKESFLKMKVDQKEYHQDFDNFLKFIMNNTKIKQDFKEEN